MELRHLRYFLAVAERLNFTEAARALQMAQPPLSVQIRNLETELGTPLFTRQNRRVTLTPAGHRFLEEARSILDQADRAVLRIQDEAAGRAGEIVIAHTDAALSDTVTRRLRKFLRRHRGLRLVTIRVESGSEPAADGLIAGFSSESLPAGAVPLERATIQVAIPPKHRLCERSEFVPADLIGENLLFSPFDGRSAAEQMVSRRLDEDGVKVSVDTCSSLLQQRFWRVSLGLGLTFCTTADRGTLDAHRIPLADPSPEIVTAFVPASKSRSAALPLLIEAIRE
jgi:DNA-binding transcriptional LysR family regulator